MRTTHGVPPPPSLGRTWGAPAPPWKNEEERKDMMAEGETPSCRPGSALTGFLTFSDAANRALIRPYYGMRNSIAPDRPGTHGATGQPVCGGGSGSAGGAGDRAIRLKTTAGG